MTGFSIPDYRIGEQLPKGSAPGMQLDVPLSAFGAPQAEALQQFGKTLDQVTDANRVEKLINAFIGKKQEKLFTDPDAFFRRKGQQAIEAEPLLMRTLTGLRDATLAEAGSDDERALLAPRLDLHIADAMDGIGRHLAAERVTRNRDILGERQALIRRAAELEHDNDDKIAGLAEAQASAARELARLDGVAPDSPEEAALLNGARSQILRAAIEQRLANAKGPQALTLYDRVKQTLSPADRRALELPIGVAADEAATDAWLARETGTDGGAPLADRAGLDDTLSDQQRLILRAKIGARESAEESRRFATVKGLDDQVAAATATIATRPALYRPGTLAQLADAYADAGAPEQAEETRRLARLEPYFRTFAQAGTAAQQRHLVDLAGPERAMAEAILRHQDDAFARDAYAAGTALYPDVGPPLPEDDADGRLRQARMIGGYRGIRVGPFSADEIAQQGSGLVLVNDPPPPQDSGPHTTVPPKRGVAVDPEPPPGSEAREAAEEKQKELLPEIGGPTSGLSHWLLGGGEPQRYPFDKIDTGSVTPEKFPAVQKILGEGKPGTYEVQGTMPFYAGQKFDSRFLLGNITLRIKGKLTLAEGGSYSFQGELGALPDRYRMYDSNHRNAVDEGMTGAGQILGSLGHGDYSIYITGKKPISSSGAYAP